jgi:flagellar protein FliJ
VPKKFSFRLQSVLNYRGQVEDTRVRALSQAKGVLLQVEEAIESHLGTQEDFRREFTRVQGSGSVVVEALAAYGDYWDSLLNREKRLEALQREAAEEVERRRQKALEASRDRKLLENLKKRKWTAYISESEREEQKALDEFSAIAYVRKDMNSPAGSTDDT